MKKILLLTIVLLVSCGVANAHPGKTDSSGGHYNRSTGEYHYHHGYSAHQHVDGECPYDYDDRTGERSGTSSGSNAKQEYKISSVYQEIEKWDTGKEVKAIQERLKSLGYSVGTVDGIFGDKTEKALKEFQRDNRIAVNGIAGKVTLSALFPEEAPVLITPKPTYKEIQPTSKPTLTLSTNTNRTKETVRWKGFSEKAIKQAVMISFGMLLFIFCIYIYFRFFTQEKRNARAQRRRQEQIERERRSLVMAQIDKAKEKTYIKDLSQGVAYINDYACDGYYHFSRKCIGGYPKLVSMKTMIDLGFVMCPKCSGDEQPTQDQYAVITPGCKNLYHSLWNKCVTENGRRTITVNEAYAMGLWPCSKCNAPYKNHDILF